MKKFLSLLLAAMMIFSVLPVTAMAAEPLTFTLKCDIDETLDCSFESLSEDYSAYKGSKATKAGTVIPLNADGYVNFNGQLDIMDGLFHDPELRGYRITIGDSTLELLDETPAFGDYYYLKDFIEANGGSKDNKSYVHDVSNADFYFNFYTTKNVTFELIYDPSAVAVTGINMEKTVLELPEGESEQLVASVLPANASLKNVTWVSKNPEVATVENGKVTGISAGTATIVATAAGRFTAECTVTVTENLDEKAAKAVEDLIAAIGTVTKDSGDAINAARKAYDALTPEQKNLVTKEAYDALVKAEKLFDMIQSSNKPGTLPGGKTDSSSSGVIKISATGAAKGENNPNTGAPAMSIAPAMLVLAAAALVLKKRG